MLRKTPPIEEDPFLTFDKTNIFLLIVTLKSVNIASKGHLLLKIRRNWKNNLKSIRDVELNWNLSRQIYSTRPNYERKE